METPLPIPDTVIIDISDEVIAFYDNSHDMEGYEMTVEQVIEEITYYIDDKYTIESSIETLYLDTLQSQSKYRGYDNSVSVAEQIAGFASAVYRKMDQLGFYFFNGLSPFVIGGFIDEETPYFVRKKDFRY
jgi:hypothetical protein